MLIKIYLIFQLLNSNVLSMNKHFTMMKEIDGILYVGGRNFLIAYDFDGEKMTYKNSKEYNFDFTNWTYLTFTGAFIEYRPEIIPNPTNAFEACLNWKEDHLNATFRDFAFDYQHARYHTPAGNWNTSNYLCTNNFIKGIEKLDDDTLWVCGTAGAIPKAFIVNRTTLNFIKIIDTNLMSCARYVDESMAVHKDSQNNLYIASGWGIYRPDKKDPDVPNNNSTILYADWRSNKNLFTLPAGMAYVLSSDVNFLDVVKETKTHLYFFGHEINNQYGLNNQEDRNAWQSFMLRICKNDLGFKYTPTLLGNVMRQMVSLKYIAGTINNLDYILASFPDEASYNSSWFHDTAHLPTTHFITPQKINFGCYIGKRPRSISDNFFWSETNVLYINKLADVIFDLNKVIKLRIKNTNELFGCKNQTHEQIPLIGLFNSPGIRGTGMHSTGALCQLQINANIFNEIGTKKPPYHIPNAVSASSAYEELMILNSATFSNFWSRTLHRSNGLTLYPYWNQGVVVGSNELRWYYHNVFDNIGKCQNTSFYNSMNEDNFMKIMNFSNTGWPNELPNRLSSIPSSVCQYSAAELYSFNATVLIPGVEFKKVFLMAENITNYYMPKLKNEDDNGRNLRRYLSPLMVVVIVSKTGVLYRIVLCDFDNGRINYGEEKSSDEWRDWCIFRYTDQPYLYRQYAPMESRERGKTYQFRASSVLLEKSIVKQKEPLTYVYGDPKYNYVKDIMRKKNKLFILTANEVYPVSIDVKCAEYTKCTECASDPKCMWEKSRNKCRNYYVNSAIPSKYLQDVLDRGFICYKAFPKTSKTLNAADVFVLNCSNSAFWRGPILWKVNKTEITATNSNGNYLLVNDQLVVVSNKQLLEQKSVIKCYGIKEDQDKLYDEAEYDWENQFSQIVLNTYNLNPKEKESYALLAWLVVFICLLVAILLAILIYWLIWKYYGHILNKRKPRKDSCDAKVSLNNEEINNNDGNAVEMKKL